MAINVQLIDALVQVGGDFQSALAFVKSFQHMPFDRERKLWTLPITDLKTFQARCTFPFDIASASQSHRSIYDRFVGDLDEAEELGYVTFPVPGRKQQIEAIFETYYDAMLKADECVRDWLADEQRKIDESYGML